MGIKRHLRRAPPAWTLTIEPSGQREERRRLRKSHYRLVRKRCSMCIVSVSDSSNRVSEDLYRRIRHMLIVAGRAGLPEILKHPWLLFCRFLVLLWIDLSQTAEFSEPHVGASNASDENRSVHRSVTNRSGRGSAWRRCIAPDGTPNLTCGRSRRPCRWRCCGARRPSWYARRSGRTCSPTTSSARSWRRRRASTPSARGRSASRGRCRRSKPSGRCSPVALDFATKPTNECWPASRRIRLAIDPAASNRGRSSDAPNASSG